MLFNGTYTVLNNETGTHKTFKIHTQSEDSKFAPGQRVLYVLDYNNEFVGLGFVNQNHVNVWKKHKGTQFEKLGVFVQRLGEGVYDGRVDVMIAKKCMRCNRELTTPESIESGIGPICAEKIK